MNYFRVFDQIVKSVKCVFDQIKYLEECVCVCESERERRKENVFVLLERENLGVCVLYLEH